jgi:hypothetical protein
VEESWDWTSTSDTPCATCPISGLEGAPELHEFDQFLDNTALLGRLLHGDKIDIFVDDGYHSDETIVRTLQSALPHLAERFVYFIEDNSEVHVKLRKLYPNLSIDSGGQLTVVSRLVR